MVEFVTIDLGECVIVRERSPVVFSGAKSVQENTPSKMCCRGSTAVVLCATILLFSGILCVPFVVSSFPVKTSSDSFEKLLDRNATLDSVIGLRQSVTSMHMPVKRQPNSTPQTGAHFTAGSDTGSVLTSTHETTMNLYDFMQADSGLLYASGYSTVSYLNNFDNPQQIPSESQTTRDDNFGKTGHANVDNFNVAPKFESRIKITCQPTTDDTLKLMMGPAFNPRYMSESRPQMKQVPSISLGAPVGGFQNDDSRHLVRHHGSFKHKEFAVESNYQRDIPEEDVFASVSTWKNARDQPIAQVVEKQHLPISNQEGHPKRTAAGKFLSRIKRFAALGGKGTRNKSSSSTTQAARYPWECKSRLIWKDLGEDHYPRFLRTVECLGDRCWFNHFQCRGRAFTVKVLRRKSDACVPVPLTGSGPTHYEQEWIFEETSVTFCCECVEL